MWIIVNRFNNNSDLSACAYCSPVDSYIYYYHFFSIFVQFRLTLPIIAAGKTASISYAFIAVYV